jgi:hypothetical protein
VLKLGAAVFQFARRERVFDLLRRCFGFAMNILVLDALAVIAALRFAAFLQASSQACQSWVDHVLRARARSDVSILPARVAHAFARFVAHRCERLVDFEQLRGQFREIDRASDQRRDVPEHRIAFRHVFAVRLLDVNAHIALERFEATRARLMFATGDRTRDVNAMRDLRRLRDHPDSIRISRTQIAVEPEPLVDIDAGEFGPEKTRDG